MCVGGIRIRIRIEGHKEKQENKKKETREKERISEDKDKGSKKTKTKKKRTPSSEKVARARNGAGDFLWVFFFTRRNLLSFTGGSRARLCACAPRACACACACAHRSGGSVFLCEPRLGWSLSGEQRVGEDRRGGTMRRRSSTFTAAACLHLLIHCFCTKVSYARERALLLLHTVTHSPPFPLRRPVCDPRRRSALKSVYSFIIFPSMRHLEQNVSDRAPSYQLARSYQNCAMNFILTSEPLRHWTSCQILSKWPSPTLKKQTDKQTNKIKPQSSGPSPETSLQTFLKHSQLSKLSGRALTLPFFPVWGSWRNFFHSMFLENLYWCQRE